MSNALSLVRLGVTLANLNAYPVILLDFSANGPQMATETRTSAHEDGQTVFYARMQNVEDSILLAVLGDDPDDLIANQRTLEYALEMARTNLTSQVRPTYLTYTPDLAAGAWITKVLYYEYEQETSRLLREDVYATYEGLATYVGQRISFYRLTLVHEPTWYGALAAIPISNVNGTDVTTGLNVNPGNDATRDNFFDVDGADLDEGSIPSPILLTLENPHASNIYKRFRISHMHTALPTHQYEAEAATIPASGITNTNSSIYSGGVARTVNIATAGSWVWCFTWALTPAQLKLLGNRWYHLVAQVPGVTGTVEMYAEVSMGSGVTVFQETEPVVISRGSIDLGAIKLPPFDVGDNEATSVDIRIFAKVATGSIQYILDFVTVMVAEETDEYSFFQPSGTGLDPDDILRVDEHERVIAQIDSSGYYNGNYYRRGSPLTVHPKKTTQRFVVLFDRAAGEAEITDYVIAKLWYRPRRMRI